jgi:hypothetical protein
MTSVCIVLSVLPRRGFNRHERIEFAGVTRRFAHIGWEMIATQ